MISIIVVTVVFRGVPIASVQPPYLRNGAIFAPLEPIVSRIARSVAIEPRGVIVITRDDRTLRLRLGEDAYASKDGTIYVRLAPVVRALGGSVGYDSLRKVATIDMPQSRALSTPSPSESGVPTVAPAAVFTPQPTVTARPVPTGVPRPRRTPIPVVPSFPDPATT